MARYFTPFAQAFDTSGNTIAGAELNFFEKGTTTKQDTFNDEALTVPNPNPVIADGGGFFPDIFLQNTTYTVDYTNASQVTIKTADVDGTESALITSFITSAGVSGTDTNGISQAVARYAVSGAMFYTDNGAADAYVLAAKSTFIIPDTLLDGWELRFRPANTNTGASTVNVNSLGVKDVVDVDGVALAGGEIDSSKDVEMVYDLANDRFILKSASASGGWTFISSATASASASLDFTSDIDGTFDLYMFIFTSMVPASDDKRLDARVSVATVFQTGADYKHHKEQSSSAADTYSGNSSGAGSTSYFLTANTGNASGESVSGILYLYNPASTALFTLMTSQASVMDFLGDVRMSFGSCSFLGSTAAVDGVQFLFTVGDITSGTVAMYGLAKS